MFLLTIVFYLLLLVLYTFIIISIINYKISHINIKLPKIKILENEKRYYKDPINMSAKEKQKFIKSAKIDKMTKIDFINWLYLNNKYGLKIKK